MPRPGSTIVHRKMVSHVAEYAWHNTCDIQTSVPTYDAFNQPIDNYVTFNGLQQIPAYLEPVLTTTDENRTEIQIASRNEWIVYLAGMYTTITRLMRALIDNVPYNILAVSFDDAKSITVLSLERIQIEQTT